MTKKSPPNKTAKTECLDQFKVDAGEQLTDQGVITAKIPSSLSAVAESFVEAIAQHRFWNRTIQQKVPA